MYTSIIALNNSNFSFTCMWITYLENMGPSTLATLFSHRWPRFCGGPKHTRATCGGDMKIMKILHIVLTLLEEQEQHARTQQSFLPLLSDCHMPHEQWLVCSLPNAATKRSVCGGDEPQPVSHLSHKLQCARQSFKIMVSYGNKYPRHKNAATCG